MRTSYAQANMTPRQETDAAANEQLLYFTTPSSTLDGHTLIAISDRFGGGVPNLAQVDRSTGTVSPLSGFTQGPAACYPYFSDGPCGLNKSSPSFHPATGRLAWVEVRPDGANRVWLTSLSAQRAEVVAEFGPGRTVGYTHISAAGERLLLPLGDARLIEIAQRRRHNRDIADVYAAEGMVTRMVEVDLRTTAARVLWEEPGWVTHCQYHPVDARRVLFNHEWTWPVGLRRLWLWEHGTRAARRCRDAGVGVGGGRTSGAEDDVSHEIWTPDGRGILYHGYWRAHDEDDVPHKGRPFIGRIDLDTGRTRELFLPDDVPAGYGHYIPSPDGERIVTDALLDPAAPHDPRRRRLAILCPHWDEERVTGLLLGAAGSSWATQDEHPHPVFTADGREVIFTSDRAGRRAIYSFPAGEGSRTPAS